MPHNSPKVHDSVVFRVLAELQPSPQAPVEKISITPPKTPHARKQLLIECLPRTRHGMCYVTLTSTAPQGRRERFRFTDEETEAQERTRNTAQFSH